MRPFLAFALIGHPGVPLPDLRAGRSEGQPPAPAARQPLRTIAVAMTCASFGDYLDMIPCQSCGGEKTQLKQFACSDPAAGPTTTLPRCQWCERFAAGGLESSTTPRALLSRRSV